MTPNNQHIKVFISYVHKDKNYLDNLRTHLTPLERNKTIEIWDDGEIIPGAEWKNEIKTHLETADIILLLVSAESLASDFFHHEEMMKALERHHKREAVVIPVILSTCGWKFTELKNLQALPKEGKPVKNWIDKSKAYNSIVAGLRKSAEQIKQNRTEIHKVHKEKERTNKDQETNTEVQKKLPPQNEVNPHDKSSNNNYDTTTQNDDSISIITRLSKLFISAKSSIIDRKSIIIKSSIPLFLLIFFYPTGSYKINTPKVNSLIHKGDSLFSEKNYADAKFYYESIEKYHCLHWKLNPKINNIKQNLKHCIDKLRIQDLPPSIRELIANMVSVEGTRFNMGCTGESVCQDDEKPRHAVTLEDYSISKFEVTQKQWFDIIEKDPNNQTFHNCDSCPVERVTITEINNFIEKLNSLTKRTFRLPTEEEWEFAARGGTKSRGFKYSGSNHIDSVAVYIGNRKNKANAVGSKKPNELGLYDMSGNVAEWCSDLYNKEYYKSKSNSSSNSKGPESGSRNYFNFNCIKDIIETHHVARGGCFNSRDEYCRVSSRRGEGHPLCKNSRCTVGFRLASGDVHSE